MRSLASRLLCVKRQIDSRVQSIYQANRRRSRKHRREPSFSRDGHCPAEIEVLEDRTLLTTLSVSDVIIAEGDSGLTTVTFDVMLDEVIGQDVTFDFTTVSNTAEAGSDFTEISGSGTIIAGQTATTIDVLINGDTRPESDEQFFVHLSNLDAGGLPIEFDPFQIHLPGITELGSFPTSETAYHVEIVGNLAYVAADSSGLRVLDVSNPANITEVGFFDTPSDAYDVQVVGNLAYVVGNNGSGLRVLDVTNPAAIFEVGFFDTLGSPFGVQVVENLAYVAYQSNGLRVLDVSNPAAISEVGFFDTPSTALDVQVVGNLAYVADFGSGLRVLDVSNPAAITEVGSFDTPDAAYDVQVVGNLAYVADRSGGLRVLDVSNPAAISEVGFFDTPGSALDVQVVGNIAYVADDSGGLRVLDVSNPASITEIGVFLTLERIQDVQVVGNVAYVAAHSSGLRVLDLNNIDDFPVITELGFLETLGFALDAQVVGDLAYVADHSGGLLVLDVSNPAAIAEVGTFDTPGNAFDVQVVGDLAYVSDSTSGLLVLDVSNPAAMTEVGSFGGLFNTFETQVVGDLAYVAHSFNGLRMLDVSDPASITEVGSFDTPNNALDLQVVGNLAYVADSSSGLRVLDVSNPASITEVGFFDTPDDAKKVRVVGNLAYVAVRDFNVGATSFGLRVLDVSNPTSITQVGFFETPDEVHDLQVVGNLAYVAANSSGLRVLDVSNPTAITELGFFETPDRVIDVQVVGDIAYVADITGGLRVLNLKLVARATATIQNDDAARLSVSNVTKAEGDSGLTILTFDVTLDEAIGQDVTFDFTTLANTAIAGSDFTPVSGSGKIKAGKTATTINVFAIGDNLVESDEQFFVELSYLQAGGQLVEFEPSQVRRSKITELGAFDTTDFVRSVQVAGNLAFVTTHSRGLRVLDISNLANITEVGTFDTPGSARDIQIVGNLAYVADSISGLLVLDVSNPAAMTEVGSFGGLFNTFETQVVGDLAYVAHSFNGLRVLDVSNPASITEVGSFDAIANPVDVQVVGNLAYVADQSSGLRVLDVSNPASITEVGFFDTPDDAKKVRVVGNLAYVAFRDFNVGATSSGLRVLDVSNPTNITEVGFFETPDDINDLKILDNLAYVAGDSSGLRVLDVSNPSSITELGFFDTPGIALDVQVVGNLAYVADLGSGLRVLNLNTARATGTIQNDDSATVTLSGLIANRQEGTGGGQTAFTFVVELDNPVDGGFDLAFTTNDGTALVADNDYLDNDGTLTFNGSANEVHTITVFANQDDKVEINELFEVVLGNISGLAPEIDASRVTVADGITQGTIQNDDSAQLTLSELMTSRPEGDGSGQTEFTFAVTLDKAVQGGFNVAYTTNDSTASAADNDYVDNDGILVFNGTANETKTITVLVNQDDKVEADEVFQVVLGAISGLAPGVAPFNVAVATGVANGTIQNDDAATLTLSGVTTEQAEGDGGGQTAYTFSVILDNAVQGGFRVAHATNDGTALVADNDYIDNDGSIAFVGNAGETQTITVLVNRDDKVEADEAFQVALGAVSGLNPEIAPANVVVAPGSLIGTIQNDDSSSLTISGVTANLQEGDSIGQTAYTFSVRLDHPVDGGFNVAYTTNDGTATVADNDYVDNDGSLTFGGLANETRTITVVVNRDDKVEIDELFDVELGTMSGLANGIDSSRVTVADGIAVGTIQNDDSATLTLEAVSVNLVEGSGGTQTAFTFSVSLDQAVEGGFDVAYTTNDGTATASDNDYVDNDGMLTFVGLAGETQMIMVLVNHDAKVEADEFFDVVLGTISGLSPGIAPFTVSVGGGSQRGTILNDDTATLVLGGLVVDQTEGNGGGQTAFTFSVSLDQAVQGGFNVSYTTNDRTALVADNDYVDNDANLRFNGTVGETRTITILVNQDAKVEADEVFEVVLTAISGLGPSIMPSQVTFVANPVIGTIRNDDAAKLILASVDNINRKFEGTGANSEAQFRFSVTLDNPVAGGLSLQYFVRNGAIEFDASSGVAKLGEDFLVDDSPSFNQFANGIGTLTFVGNASERLFLDIATVPDAIVEADEFFHIELGAITLLDSNLSPTLVVISDDDPGDRLQEAVILNRLNNVPDDISNLSVQFDQFVTSPTGEQLAQFSITSSNAVEEGFTVSLFSDTDSANLLVSPILQPLPGGSATFAGTPNEMQFVIVPVPPTTSLADELRIVLGNVVPLQLGVRPEDIIPGSPVILTTTEDQVLVTGAGPGGTAHVRVIVNNIVVMELFPYPGFGGGVRVTTADVSGDGTPDIVTAPGPGGGPIVLVFDGTTGNPIHQFAAYPGSFTFGLSLAAADFNGDGRAEIVTAPDLGGGSHVRVFDLTKPTLDEQVVTEFFSHVYYSQTPPVVFTGGIRIALGNVTGDATPEIITVPATNGGPILQLYDGRSGGFLGQFAAYNVNFGAGLFVATGDFNNDGVAEIFTGPNAGGGPVVRIFNAPQAFFDPQNTGLLRQFGAYPENVTAGVRVAVTDFDRNGTLEIVTVPGAGNPGTVRFFEPLPLDPQSSGFLTQIEPFDGFNGGVFLGNASPGINGPTLQTVSIANSEVEASSLESLVTEPTKTEASNVETQIAEIQLGEVLGNTIILDANAVGPVWYIDSTTEDDPDLGTEPSAVLGQRDLLPGIPADLERISVLSLETDEGHFMSEPAPLGKRGRGESEDDLAVDDFFRDFTIDFAEAVAV